MSFTDGLVELVLIVDDLARARVFYEDVLRLAPASEASVGWAWYWTGAPGDVGAGRLALHTGSLMFEEHTPRARKGVESPFGQVHAAFRVMSDRIDEALGHLDACGVTVHGPVDLDWMDARSWYFFDPDGNLLEFWVPNTRV